MGGWLDLSGCMVDWLYVQVEGWMDRWFMTRNMDGWLKGCKYRWKDGLSGWMVHDKV